MPASVDAGGATERASDTSAGAVARGVALVNTVWSAILERRELDAEALEAASHVVVDLPGDGLVEPVSLAQWHVGHTSPAAHALDVARLAYLAARSAGWPVPRVTAVLAAALLADIGMAEIPAEILARPERLRDGEFRVVQRHPAIGARVLLATPGVDELAAVVAWEHHMRPDGRGYPQPHAATWRVREESRLVQVCDVYAALRSPRPFRPALSEERARALMRSLAGRWVAARELELVLERALPAGCDRSVGADRTPVAG